MKQMLRYVTLCVLLMGSMLCLSACKPKTKEEGEQNMINFNQNVYAQIEFSTKDRVNLVLYPDKAPLSVENFVHLAQEDFYVGTIFHRIIEEFMIQTGGYYIDGNNLMDKKGVAPIQGEFASNGYPNNDIKHTLGVISMARTSDPNSATSQFFLCCGDCKWLDGDYAAFGKTTDEASNDVILKLSRIKTGTLGYGFSDFPTQIVSITKVRVSNEAFH